MTNVDAKANKSLGVLLIRVEICLYMIVLGSVTSI